MNLRIVSKSFAARIDDISPPLILYRELLYPTLQLSLRLGRKQLLSGVKDYRKPRKAEDVVHDEGELRGLTFELSCPRRQVL